MSELVPKEAPWIERSDATTPYAMTLIDLHSMAWDFGIQLSDRAIKVLHAMADAMNRLDTPMDRSGEPERVARDICEALKPGEQPETEVGNILRPLVSLLDAETLRELLTITEDMLDLNLRLKRATDVGEYIDLTLEEGSRTADMVLLLVRDEVRGRFADFLKDLVPTGNLIDDIQDLREDHQEGEKALKPSLGFYLRAIATAFKGLLKLGIQYPNKRLLPHFALRIVT